MTKICTKCGQTKELPEFHRSRKGKHGRSSVCKDCKSQYHSTRYKYEKDYWQKPENKARKKRNARKHYLNKKREVLNRNRKANLFSKYGITCDDYDRMLVEQYGCCKICGKRPGKRRLHIDHDHDSGAVRGLLCQNCNHLLGNAKDSPDILRLAASYLEEYCIE